MQESWSASGCKVPELAFGQGHSAPQETSRCQLALNLARCMQKVLFPGFPPRGSDHQAASRRSGWHRCGSHLDDRLSELSDPGAMNQRESSGSRCSLFPHSIRTTPWAATLASKQQNRRKELRGSSTGPRNGAVLDYKGLSIKK